jgi:8-oxo-dGTP diphosphatase
VIAPTDAFDVVRAYYRALNSRDVESVTQLYDAACIVEQVFLGAAREVQRGREACRLELERFFQRYDNGFEDGACFRVRSIAGNETGWGWVQAEWIQRVRDKDGVRQFRGYSHFLVEDGLIRRHRSVDHEMPPDEEAPPERSPSQRRYPSQPIVGVGAVIAVPAESAAAIGWTEHIAGTGVVLVKRRFEPLAGQWSLPGGAVELGETLEAAVAREMVEETGLAVDVGPVVEVFDRILLDHETRVRYHFVLIDYLCYPRAGRLRAGSDVADVTVADPRRLEPFELTAKAQDVIRKCFHELMPGR